MSNAFDTIVQRRKKKEKRREQNCMLAINVPTFARRDKIIPACRSLNNIARIFFILIIYTIGGNDEFILSCRHIILLSRSREYNSKLYNYNLTRIYNIINYIFYVNVIIYLSQIE